MSRSPRLLRSRLAMRLLALFAMAIAAAAANARPVAAPAGGDDKSWSEESNGLRARLSVRRAYVSNGTGIIVTHLELANVSDLGDPMLVTVTHDGMAFRVTDADGRDVPQFHGAFDGMDFGPPEVVLPFDSSIRFRIGPGGSGIPGDQAALVDLGSSFSWVLPRDGGKAYFLQATLELPKVKDEKNGMRQWNGKLELPRVRIPTTPEPQNVDAAALGRRIDELGGQMLAKSSRVSESAVRELSLIDDPRVIPWYVKAVKARDYSLKFSALDRLSRLEGDEAFEGLKIGMSTRGEDIGNATTAAVAAQSAAGIRHSAAGGLARSPHPKAKALLLSMEDDASTAVRITVIQAAARMTTPESLELLRRRTKDKDETVSGEAARLLKLRLDAVVN